MGQIGGRNDEWKNCLNRGLNFGVLRTFEGLHYTRKLRDDYFTFHLLWQSRL